MTAVADMHVHVRSLAEVGAVLDAAVGNFGAAASAFGRLAVLRVLFLARTSAADPGADAGALSAAATGWSFQQGEARDVTRAMWADHEICLVEGWQLVTSEGLEVLALGCTTAPPAAGGRAPELESTLDWAAEHARLVVLPWGVGKWFGRRGRAVRDALRARPGIFLADTGTRPPCWPTPVLLERAAAGGRPVLAGSDPLPFEGETARAGSAGVLVDVRPHPDRPVASLCAALRCAGGARVASYARFGGFGHFLRTQVAMQRLRRRA